MWIILVIVLIISVTSIFLLFRDEGKTGKAIINEPNTENTTNQQTNTDSPTTTEPTETNGGSGDSGGSSGGGSGGGSGGSTTGTTSPPTDDIPDTETCREKQISYSVKNLKEISTCNIWQYGCTDKTINCSVDIQNLDYETAGNFEIKFTISDESENEITYKTVNYFLEIREGKTFEALIIVIGENADKELSCSYNTIIIPRKQICD